MGCSSCSGKAVRNINMTKQIPANKGVTLPKKTATPAISTAAAVNYRVSNGVKKPIILR